jgi:hypothetical protein
VLTELEEELVRHAVEHLGGKFHIHNLAAAFKGRIGMKRIWRLAKNWELRGWLIPGPSRADGRRVSDELLGLLSFSHPEGRVGPVLPARCQEGQEEQEGTTWANPKR